MDRKPPKLAVDANGYVWRVFDAHWSMAPQNPDNSPIPQPVTYYVPEGAAWRPQDRVSSSAIREAERLTGLIRDLSSLGELEYRYAGYDRIVVKRDRDGIHALFETCKPETASDVR